jgi:hypothetical protein
MNRYIAVPRRCLPSSGVLRRRSSTTRVLVILQAGGKPEGRPSLPIADGLAANDGGLSDWMTLSRQGDGPFGGSSAKPGS